MVNDNKINAPAASSAPGSAGPPAQKTQGIFLKSDFEVYDYQAFIEKIDTSAVFDSKTLEYNYHIKIQVHIPSAEKPLQRFTVSIPDYLFTDDKKHNLKLIRKKTIRYYDTFYQAWYTLKKLRQDFKK